MILPPGNISDKHHSHAPVEIFQGGDEFCQEFVVRTFPDTIQAVIDKHTATNLEFESDAQTAH
jgi:hypothetical protein